MPGARHGQSDVPAFWCAGAIFLAVAFGMLRRSRHRLLATADELVIQSRNAAAAVEVGTELSRDLHDVLAHSLSGVTMQLSMADALFEAGRIEQGRTALKQVQRLEVGWPGRSAARRFGTPLRRVRRRNRPTGGRHLLDIGDDGAGRLEIANAAARASAEAHREGSGPGLVGMREGAAGLGGTLTAGPVMERRVRGRFARRADPAAAATAQ